MLTADQVLSVTQESQGPQDKPDPDSTDETNDHTSFWVKDIGYFKPIVNANKDIIVKNCDMIYQNVFFFTNWVWVKATTVDPELICQNLDFCLLDQTDKWYTEELSYIQ